MQVKKSLPFDKRSSWDLKYFLYWHTVSVYSWTSHLVKSNCKIDLVWNWETIRWTQFIFFLNTIFCYCSFFLHYWLTSYSWRLLEEDIHRLKSLSLHMRHPSFLWMLNGIFRLHAWLLLFPRLREPPVCCFTQHTVTTTDCSRLGEWSSLQGSGNQIGCQFPFHQCETTTPSGTKH